MSKQKRLDLGRGRWWWWVVTFHGLRTLAGCCLLCSKISFLSLSMAPVQKVVANLGDSALSYSVYSSRLVKLIHTWFSSGSTNNRYRTPFRSGIPERNRAKPETPAKACKHHLALKAPEPCCTSFPYSMQ